MTGMKCCLVGMNDTIIALMSSKCCGYLDQVKLAKIVTQMEKCSQDSTPYFGTLTTDSSSEKRAVLLYGCGHL